MVVKFEIDDEEGLMAEQLPASPKHIGLGHTTSSKAIMKKKKKKKSNWESSEISNFSCLTISLSSE